MSKLNRNLRSSKKSLQSRIFSLTYQLMGQRQLKNPIQMNLRKKRRNSKKKELKTQAPHQMMAIRTNMTTSTPGRK